MKLYDLALIYFGKYLEHAWYVADTDAELHAYDLLGVASYLLGELQNAQYFHEKMLRNDNEPEDSARRVIGIKKIDEKFKNLNSDQGSAKLSIAYKKFFAKIHGGNQYFDDDFTCSSDEEGGGSGGRYAQVGSSSVAAAGGTTKQGRRSVELKAPLQQQATQKAN